LFVWVKLPDGYSANDLFPLAGQEKVTFTPGSYFYPGARHQPYLRLNFVIHPTEVIDEGIRRLGRAIDRLLAERARVEPEVPEHDLIKTAL
jgi:2-aminoadipate transaminase